MLEGLLGIPLGIAAHQSNRIIKGFFGNWNLVARYIVGYLTCGIVFFMIINRIRSEMTKDAIIAYFSAGASVGIGVMAGMLLDESKVHTP